MPARRVSGHASLTMIVQSLYIAPEGDQCVFKSDHDVDRHIAGHDSPMTACATASRDDFSRLTVGGRCARRLMAALVLVFYCYDFAHLNARVSGLDQSRRVRRAAGWCSP